MIINGINLDVLPASDSPFAQVSNEVDHITVVCVWWGTLYGREYVEKLRDAVKRHLTIPYEFVVITDRDDDIPGAKIIAAIDDNEGWWQKITLFKPNLFTGRILYFDLDIVITNSIDDIAKSAGELVMIRNFGPNHRTSPHNSSCMVWTPCEKTENIYTKFTKDVTTNLHGDQCWIGRVGSDFILNFKLPLITSYKYEKRNYTRKDHSTAVWVFHGQPNPHEVEDKWVKENW